MLVRCPWSVLGGGVVTMLGRGRRMPSYDGSDAHGAGSTAALG